MLLAVWGYLQNYLRDRALHWVLPDLTWTLRPTTADCLPDRLSKMFWVAHELCRCLSSWAFWPGDSATLRGRVLLRALEFQIAQDVLCNWTHQRCTVTWRFRAMKHAAQCTSRSRKARKHYSFFSWAFYFSFSGTLQELPSNESVPHVVTLRLVAGNYWTCA